MAQDYKNISVKNLNARSKSRNIDITEKSLIN